MTTHTPTPPSRARRRTPWWVAGVVVATLVGCAAPPAPPPPPPAPAKAPEPPPPPPPPVAPPPPPPPAAPAAPPPIQPFEQALLSAANNLLGKAQLNPPGPFNVVIDPLIDGVTGAQTQATQAMGNRLAKLIGDSYAKTYSVKPFNVSTVQQGPLLLVGTFTGVNGERKTEGKREAYRICLALADLKTGKLVSKGLAFAEMDGVDPTPLPFFRDAPVWQNDPAITGYIRTCQGTRAGDSINPAYLDKIITAATISEAIDAYNKSQYADALKLYEVAKGSPGGAQLRVHTGLYLTNLKLRRMGPARNAFGDIVDHGLDEKRLGVKFLFRPGTAALWVDPKAGPLPYPMWLTEIASRASKRQVCLELGGHASATGSEPLNERLSLLRADSVKESLAAIAPALGKRMTSKGYGSQQMLVGNARDDLSDALDRRVEMKVEACGT